ncbi:MAG: phosphotransferase, partial [Streptosporangiaceae bacterium]
MPAPDANLDEGASGRGSDDHDQGATGQASDDPDPAAVTAAFGLAGPVTGWTAVGRAWSNRVFRLEAGGRPYAVKEIRNPWDDPRWPDWLAHSWPFELRAIAAGVAAPRLVPEPATGGCLAWVPRRDPALTRAPVRVHHWADGEPLATVPVTPPTARWAGQALAVLHGLAVRPQTRDLYPSPNTTTADRWPELTESVRRAGAAWAGLLDQAAPAVRGVAALSRADGFRPEME